MARLTLDPEQLRVTSFAPLPAPPAETVADAPESAEATYCYWSCAALCFTWEYHSC